MAMNKPADKRTSMEHKDVLRDMIKTRSFKKADTPSFPLTSGKMSSFYFNLKSVTLASEGMYHIGHVVLDKIEELDLQPKAIGGLTMGADPIAAATALVSHLRHRDIQAFSIRKEPKKHGLKLQIEGDLRPRDEVIILDDVVTTGGSTIKAIDIAREHDLKVTAVIILVDRCEENGKENIEKKGVKVHAIFTVYDFI
jgi:orotate phosphoribosyltransferase